MRVEAEILHQRKEIGMVVIDHGGLAEARKAKRNKDYARSDAIREQLKQAGIVLEDTREGTRWTRG